MAFTVKYNLGVQLAPVDVNMKSGKIVCKYRLEQEVIVYLLSFLIYQQKTLQRSE